MQGAKVWSLVRELRYSMPSGAAEKKKKNESKLQYFGYLMQRADSLEKISWCWERLRTGEGNDRGWDGWMASPTQWTWVWVGSGNWWWTGRPGVLQFMESQRVRHDWMAELNWCTKHTPSHLHMNTVTFHWFSTNELFTFKDAAKRDF